MKELQADYYFNLRNFDHKELFKNIKYAWEPLKKLPEYIKSNHKKKVIIDLLKMPGEVYF